MAILDIITGTPLWVWAALLYLLFIGIRALQRNTVPLALLVLVPLFLGTWSAWSLLARHTCSLLSIGVLIFAFTIGSALGRVLLCKNITIDKKRMLVSIPGSWLPLLLYLVFFVVKYILGATYAITPAMQQHIFFLVTDIVASGFITGMFSGRLFYVIHKYLQPAS